MRRVCMRLRAPDFAMTFYHLRPHCARQVGLACRGAVGRSSTEVVQCMSIYLADCARPATMTMRKTPRHNTEMSVLLAGGVTLLEGRRCARLEVLSSIRCCQSPDGLLSNSTLNFVVSCHFAKSQRLLSLVDLNSIRRLRESTSVLCR